MAKEHAMEKQKNPAVVHEALDHARARTQELFRIVGALLLAKRATHVMKAEVEGAIQKAKEAAESTRSAMRVQHGAAQEAIKQRLTEAVSKLEAAEKHAAESLKSSGETSHTALGKAQADARASVQHISEAIAALRSERAAKQPAKRAS